jgi:hypothetical protein
MKYTYSDEEDGGVYSDATSTRRSTRNTRGNTPADGLIAPTVTTVTLSGRQVKSRVGGTYGETILSGAHTPALSTGGMDGTSEEPEDGEPVRPRRAAAAKIASNGWGAKKAHIEGYNSVDEMDSDEDDASEQDYGDDEEEEVPLESDEDESVDLTDDDDMEVVATKKSLVVKLPVKTPTPEKKTVIKLHLSPNRPVAPAAANGNGLADPEAPIISAKAPLSPASDASALIDETTKIADASGPTLPTSSLTFRGSPEKPLTLPPNINVSGYEVS